VLSLYPTLLFFFKKLKKPNANIKKKKKFSSTEVVKKACIELATPTLELITNIKTVVCKYKANFFEIVLLALRCRSFKVTRKFVRPKTSIKSQPHQPFQFNSCWAHQLPKIREYNDATDQFLRADFLKKYLLFFFVMVKIDKV
jgi:hypothetical protein